MKFHLKTIFTIILLSNLFFICSITDVTSLGGEMVLSEEKPVNMVSFNTFSPKFHKYFNNFKISIDKSNHIYVGGHMDHDQYNNLLLMTDMKGNLLWENNTSKGSIYDIAVDSLGNVYCTGVKYDATREIYLMKYSKSGVFLWNKTLTGKGHEWGRGVSVDSLDNVYIAGYNSSINADHDEIICAKYNPLGEQEWLRVWGKDENATCFDCTTDNSNNIYLVGYVETSNDNDMCIVKYDSLGNELWNLTFPYKKLAYTDERLWTITADANGNIFVAGDIYNVAIFIAKFDSNGINLWNATWDIDNKVLGVEQLIVDSEGNLYMIGNYRPFESGDWRYGDHLYNYLVKFRNGIEQWHYYWKISDFNIGGGIALNQNDIYICGSTGGTLYLAKFSESLPTIALYMFFLGVGGSSIIFIGTRILKKRKIVKSE